MEVYLILDDEVYNNQEIINAASGLLTAVINNDSIPFNYRVAYLAHLRSFIDIYLQTLQEAVKDLSEGDEQ